MKPRFTSQFRDDKLEHCLGVLSDDYLIWSTLPVSKDTVKQVFLPNVVCACALDELNTSCSFVKLLKLDSTPLQEQGLLFGFNVSTVEPREENKWHITNHLFWCQSNDDRSQWLNAMKWAIKLTAPSRPHRLLAFINPSSGHKMAEKVYGSVVDPLFRLSGIETTTIVTTHRNHATEYLVSNTSKEFDGVVCVGGDGFFSEIVQGLLLRERIEAGLPVHTDQKPGGVEIPTTMRIGIIPAGSTDTVVFSTHGTNDVLTAALHIILGDDLALDVTAIHSGDTGDFLRYAVSMVGFGFHADLLKNDDKLRWMGPRRYDLSGFTTFLSHSIYSGEISFLPSANRTSHSRDGVSCRSGCSVCSTSTRSWESTAQFDGSSSCDGSSYTPADKPVASSEVASSVSSTGSGQGGSDSPEVDFYLGGKEIKAVDLGEARSQPSLSALPGPDKLTNGTKLTYKSLLSMWDRRGHRTTARHDYWIRERMSAGLQPALSYSSSIWVPDLEVFPRQQGRTPPSWSLQGCASGWQTLLGRFVAINAFIQSCRCVKATCGPAPWAHLGDGCLDLILVHKCSRRQFLQYLLRISRGQSAKQSARGKSAFDLPFVSVHRVCAFRFRTVSDDNLDDDDDESVSPRSKHWGPKHAYGRLEMTSRQEDSGTQSSREDSLLGNGESPEGRDEGEAEEHVYQRREPAGNKSVWCADGELVRYSNVDVFVHRQLIRVFARGPEAVDSIKGRLEHPDPMSLLSSASTPCDLAQKELSNHCSSGDSGLRQLQFSFRWI